MTDEYRTDPKTGRQVLVSIKGKEEGHTAVDQSSAAGNAAAAAKAQQGTRPRPKFSDQATWGGASSHAEAIRKWDEEQNRSRMSGGQQHDALKKQ